MQNVMYLRAIFMICIPSICQDHYDWGLRAIKSVLVVAGSLKREDRSRPEEQVHVKLMSLMDAAIHCVCMLWIWEK